MNLESQPTKVLLGETFSEWLWAQLVLQVVVMSTPQVEETWTVAVTAPSI
jgi:hypothetical protein